MNRIRIEIDKYLTRNIPCSECEITYQLLGPMVVVTEYHISPTLCKYVDSWEHLNAHAQHSAERHYNATQHILNNQTA